MTLNALGLSKKYYRPKGASSHFEAVKPFDFELKGGEIAAIGGRSGSGKSTLLYLMAALLSPSGGTLLRDGQDIGAMDDESLSAFRNKYFGVIPQGQTGLFSLNLLENVTVPAALLKGSDKAAAETSALALLGRLGIAELSRAKMAELSGGEMRRMAVARALVLNPSVIFADEPTDDLDDENTRLVLSLLREYADKGAAVLLVTHEKEAQKVSDRVFRMDAGNLFLERG